ncbi:MAG: hypothetical protein ACNJA3_28610 (plasmid) [Pseudomonas rhizophila]|uniref:hypothetical protein n=1 Tax=Pseudomonas rhizophila TaxID=2045200 RepID=UPI003F6CD8FC
MRNQILDLNPKLADKAKAAETAALNDFHEKVVKLSETFSIKETARLLRVSTGFLRTHSVQRGVTFADRESRTPAEKRKVKKLWDHYLIHYETRQVQAPTPFVKPGDLAINPGLELKSRRAWVNGQNAFLARCVELSELFTVAEAADILKVSHRFLKTYAYNEQITFVGGPSLDVKNEFYCRAEKLAADKASIQAAAQTLNVTTRFLTGFAKHWQLPFIFPDSVDSIAADPDDISFMEDMCIDEDGDDELVMSDTESNSDSVTSSPYYERPTNKQAYGSSYALF